MKLSLLVNVYVSSSPILSCSFPFSVSWLSSIKDAGDSGLISAATAMSAISTTKLDGHSTMDCRGLWGGVRSGTQAGEIRSGVPGVATPDSSFSSSPSLWSKASSLSTTNPLLVVDRISSMDMKRILFVVEVWLVVVAPDKMFSRFEESTRLGLEGVSLKEPLGDPSLEWLDFRQWSESGRFVNHGF